MADRLPQANQTLQDYSLIVAGMQFKEGPGFIVLTGTALPGELLLDSSCATARSAEVAAPRAQRRMAPAEIAANNAASTGT